ncbi:hypothetical protein G9406_00975 [Weissella paramesenteroides]|uniref:hypothetical protein n=1 Tax=Weissella paramesenteroides TaxID=1249 RepID=UPI0024029C50|nr:hypothetical protein [Weissella paramesenteroides]MDF8366185.1 hypothetical protein [Weissella paramesenteroides]
MINTDFLLSVKSEYKRLMSRKAELMLDMETKNFPDEFKDNMAKQIDAIDKQADHVLVMAGMVVRQLNV